jgi:hypothetical protein
MKTLPGIKIVGFVALASVIGLAVYAGTKDNTPKKKHHKYIVRFGWSETTANDLEPAPHSVEQIEGYLAAVDHSRYLIQYYVDSQANGNPKGDLDLCLPTPPPANAAATPTPAAPQPAASGTPAGAKTQTAGFAQFESSQEADAFTDWVNDPTAAVPSKASSKSKGKK